MRPTREAALRRRYRQGALGATGAVAATLVLTSTAWACTWGWATTQAAWNPVTHTVTASAQGVFTNGTYQWKLNYVAETPAVLANEANPSHSVVPGGSHTAALHPVCGYTTDGDGSGAPAASFSGDGKAIDATIYHSTGGTGLHAGVIPDNVGLGEANPAVVTFPALPIGLYEICFNSSSLGVYTIPADIVKTNAG